MTDGAVDDGRVAFPRVPAYAWSWLQRSRPVLHEVARRLTGAAPTAQFLDEVRERFTDDPFVRDVVIAAVCEVAFNGRVPQQRPPGASWDRGLTWWAATIAGVTPAAFEGTGGDDAPRQEPLFAVEERPPRSARARGPSPERAALARALRRLLDSARDDAVPADAVRRLLADLERT